MWSKRSFGPSCGGRRASFLCFFTGQVPSAFTESRKKAFQRLTSQLQAYKVIIGDDNDGGGMCTEIPGDGRVHLLVFMSIFAAQTAVMAWNLGSHLFHRNLGNTSV